MAPVDQVEEGVRRRGFVVTLLDLPDADVVDDQQVGGGPALESPRVGRIGEAGVEVVEEVDAASVKDAHLLLTGAQAERLDDVALARAAHASDDEVVLAADEFEGAQLHDEGLVQVGLEGPLEGLQCLALGQAAVLDAALDAPLELVGSLGAEDALEQDAAGRLLVDRPGQMLVELLEGLEKP